MIEFQEVAVHFGTQDVLTDVCRHRLLLKENVRETTAAQVLDELLKKVENPDRRGLFSGIKK